MIITATINGVKLTPLSLDQLHDIYPKGSAVLMKKLLLRYGNVYRPR